MFYSTYCRLLGHKKGELVLKKQTGKVLVGVAFVALIGGITTVVWPQPPPLQALDFTVQCANHAELVDVQVVTPDHEGQAEQKVRDPNNKHYGAFTYTVANVHTVYSVKVTCTSLGKRSSFESEHGEWGSSTHFGCSVALDGCVPITNSEVAISVLCEDAQAFELFVMPRVNAAGSADLLDTRPPATFKRKLASPTTPYAIEVGCKTAQGVTWRAVSDPEQAAIGSTTFRCVRPTGVAVQGRCTR
jgi:hypothetical protein